VLSAERFRMRPAKVSALQLSKTETGFRLLHRTSENSSSGHFGE
jgi:hypothetical protein